MAIKYSCKLHHKIACEIYRSIISNYVNVFPVPSIFRFVCVRVLPPKSTHNFMMACCSVQSVVAFLSDVLNIFGMFLLYYLLKIFCSFKNGFKLLYKIYNTNCFTIKYYDVLNCFTKTVIIFI